MHGRLYNELVIDITLRPKTPLLIKAGGQASQALDPTVPDMSFVRCKTGSGEHVYIPGASFRGVIRSQCEKMVRSIKENAACSPVTQKEGTPGGISKACMAQKQKIDELSCARVYGLSCYTCRIFGNTDLASRIRVSDLMPVKDPAKAPVTDVRYGVAIDRVTGAVAHGPFQLETVSDGFFAGQVNIRNFTLGQLGLFSAALLDIADGLVPLGYGKSRGLGRVHIELQRSVFRFCREAGAGLAGVGALAPDEVRKSYRLPGPEKDFIELNCSMKRNGMMYSLEGSAKESRSWMERLVDCWPGEVEGWQKW